MTFEQKKVLPCALTHKECTSGDEFNGCWAKALEIREEEREAELRVEARDEIHQMWAVRVTHKVASSES